MNLAWVDILIIFLYLIGTVWIGFWLSQRARKNIQGYFLGGNQLPWYVLGLSNASGMFDISGVMWTVSITFVYGLKSAWIPWLWPVWNQIFVMIFLAQWMRRSNVMTGAEWISFRFGNGIGGKLAHAIVVVFAVLTVIAFMGYFVEGIGKFATTFLPWDLSVPAWNLSSEDGYALVIIGITTIYTVKGGMFSVVGTEVLQFVLMTLASVVIGVIAIRAVTPEQIAANVPVGWRELWFSWELNLDWSEQIPAVNDKIATDGYSMFGFLMILMIFKGIWASLAGPVPSYDMQRVLSTRSPSEAAKMGGITPLVLFIPRYLMIGGLTVLALVYFSPELRDMGTNVDFEQILPFAIREYVPVGFRGILLAGLLAAFMGTYSAFLNAGPAYIVNDIYKKYIRPDAPQKEYVRLSYISTFVVVAIGLIAGFAGGTLQEMTLWIVSYLYGGYAAANALKWIWWRFNGYGYFVGMLAGLLGVIIVPAIVPAHWSAIEAFPVLLLFALTACVISTFLTAPDDEEVLKEFYRRTRPWGFWKPIREKVEAENPDFKSDANLGRDALNVGVGITWQMTMVVIPLYLVIQDWYSLGASLSIFALTSWFLKQNWYDKLRD